MTNNELEVKNRAATSDQLAIGYTQTKELLGGFEQILEAEKLEFATRPDMYEGWTYATRKQIADLRRELAAYEREFHRRGLPLTARESSPQAA